EGLVEIYGTDGDWIDRGFRQQFEPRMIAAGVGQDLGSTPARVEGEGTERASRPRRRRCVAERLRDRAGTARAGAGGAVNGHLGVRQHPPGPGPGRRRWWRQWIVVDTTRVVLSRAGPGHPLQADGHGLCGLGRPPDFRSGLVEVA